ncbi:hypothetical protein [Bradyrhizobium sp. Ec3.3]|uniref:hypothetical protein n=1 Tax=Bradyrhizobium sp. Ec3.3 TaxID=189753 RepID=UPI0003F92136|nr:hypothetical protein [Bradyrhizobium sp. Ec3.3]
MKIREITVSQSVRVNLGDYQATDFFVSMNAELEDGDKPLDAAASLRRRIGHALTNSVGANFKARGKTISPAKIASTYGIERTEK